jgi:hypothetical protein
LIAKKKNPAVRLAVTIAAAQVEASAGRTAPASSMLERTAAEAGRLGFQGLQLEARLAQGELGAASGAAASNERLQALEQEARAKGFGLIAARAAAARMRSSSRTVAK